MIRFLIKLLAAIMPQPDFETRPTLRNELEEKRLKLRLMSEGRRL